MATLLDNLEGALQKEESEPSPEKVSFHKSAHDESSIDALLSQEDLLRIYEYDPKWRRFRIVLLILFGVVWVGLLAGSVVVILLTPKCPPIPSLAFWQTKTGYWVDPFAFKDSNGDFVGDFNGLTEKLGYIKNIVGAGFVVLGSFVSGTFSGAIPQLGLVTDFYTVDSSLGTIDDFRNLIKSSHRIGLEVVVTLDFNSVSTSHKWVNKTDFLKSSPTISAVARAGSNALVNIDDKQFYSVFGQYTVDLNLDSKEVVAELTNVVNYWLNEGIDGILLSDVAFYVEEKFLPCPKTNKSGINEWFLAYPDGQIFTQKTVDFVSKIRTAVDSVSNSTGRPILLAVDAGDTGYGLENQVDRSTIFLGTLERPAAHMIISRQFVKRRGWKMPPTSDDFEHSSIASYDVVSGQHSKYIALCTATPSDQRYDDILSLAATLLLPGTPLIYYGTEFAMVSNQTFKSPTSIYPKGKVPFPNLSLMDNSVSSHLPMPWDRSGIGYSPAFTDGKTFAEYLDSFAISETVQSATSHGRGTTAFQLVQSLIQLRKKPNLMWGSYSRLNLVPSGSMNYIELFTRQAEGYPVTIIALIRKPRYGAAYNLATVCDRIVPTFIYPRNPNMQLNVPVHGNSVFLKSSGLPTVYVFDCA